MPPVCDDNHTRTCTRMCTYTYTYPLDLLSYTTRASKRCLFHSHSLTHVRSLAPIPGSHMLLRTHATPPTVLTEVCELRSLTCLCLGHLALLLADDGAAAGAGGGAGGGGLAGIAGPVNIWQVTDCMRSTHERACVRALVVCVCVCTRLETPESTTTVPPHVLAHAHQPVQACACAYPRPSPSPRPTHAHPWTDAHARARAINK